MAGLVATVTHNNHPRGPVYADDDRVLQNYDYESAYARKPQVSIGVISRGGHYTVLNVLMIVFQSTGFIYIHFARARIFTG